MSVSFRGRRSLRRSSFAEAWVERTRETHLCDYSGGMRWSVPMPRAL
jgi:hypothetical protein